MLLRKARDTFIEQRRAWLMKKLYSQRSTTGDIVFVFPGHLQEGTTDPVEIKCHSEVLVSQSAYFKGLFDFNEASQQVNKKIVKQEIQDHSPVVFRAMIDFMYLPEVSIDSNDMIDILDLCREYILPKLKQAVEIVFSEKIDYDNFADLMQLSRAFDMDHLRRALVIYGKLNYLELKRNAKGFLNLSKQDLLDLK